MYAFSDIQINDQWLSELVAQGYSQLVEGSDEAKSHIRETAMEVGYSALPDSLDG